MLLQLEKEIENHINNKKTLWGQSREVDISFSISKNLCKKTSNRENLLGGA